VYNPCGRSVQFNAAYAVMERPSSKNAFLISSILVIVSILRSSLLEFKRTKRVFGFGRAFNGRFAILGISNLHKTGDFHFAILVIFSLQQTLQEF